MNVGDLKLQKIHSSIAFHLADGAVLHYAFISQSFYICKHAQAFVNWRWAV
jgi:hypothetical protein